MMPIQYKKFVRPFTMPRSSKESDVFSPKMSCILCNQKLNANTTEHNCNVRQQDNSKSIVVNAFK
jgi:hypothetical protein